MSSFKNKLIDTLRSLNLYNRDAESAPHCVLWTDENGNWEKIIPLLQEDMPELFVLGDYEPEARRGPSIWLRCMVGSAQRGIGCHQPVLYLPKVSRKMLRAVADCPADIKPLVELQYRGVLWSQENSKDWTPLALMISKKKGMGLSLAGQSKNMSTAVQNALPVLLDTPIDRLKQFEINEMRLNQLILGDNPDTYSLMLKWLNDADSNKIYSKEKKVALRALFLKEFNFDMEQQSALDAAQLLQRQPNRNWERLWYRYEESFDKYRNIPKHLRAAEFPHWDYDLLEGEHPKLTWLKKCEDKDVAIEKLLQEIKSYGFARLADAVDTCYKENEIFMDSFWTEQGFCPWMKALKLLKELGDVLRKPLDESDWVNLKHGYTDFAWNADRLALQLIRTGEEKPAMKELIGELLQQSYLPWINQRALKMQTLAKGNPYPADLADALSPQDNECRLFIDGLRYDLGRRLAELLKARGLDTQVDAYYSPLPTITSTGKPAVSFANKDLIGQVEQLNFTPKVRETGGTWGANTLKQSNQDMQERMNCSWGELGDIDHDGHAQGCKMTRYVEDTLVQAADEIERLAQEHSIIRIVTDHGWLMMPGGLPKAELPKCMTEDKSLRIAVLKDSNLAGNYPTYPWFWNEQLRFTIAEGVSCFRDGTEYTHGGMSLQECIVPVIGVKTQTGASRKVGIKTHKWKGLRCYIELDNAHNKLRLDIRQQAANPASSIVMKEAEINPEQAAKVLVEDAKMLDTIAFIVILDDDNNILTQKQITIGE